MSDFIIILKKPPKKVGGGGSSPPSPPVSGDALLLEIGDYVLLEIGDKILLDNTVALNTILDANDEGIVDANSDYIEQYVYPPD